MLTDNLDNTRQDKQKRTYQTPCLVRYGSVADLTKNGGSGPSENNNPLGCNRNDRKNNPACPSDRRLKENIVRVGSHPLGIGLYLFDYRMEYRAQWGHGRQFGVMAQEVEAVMPEAIVSHPDGYLTVNYDLLGITRQ
jgi:hypothetical protein